MKLIVSQLSESLLCTLPCGEHIEITMLSAEGEELILERDIQRAVDLLFEHTDFLSTTV